MSPHRSRALTLAVATLLSAVIAGNADAVQFELYTFQSGLTGTTTGAAFGNGAAAFDLEGDGDIDLYLTNGGNQPNRLLANDGSFSFTNLPNALGADHAGESKGAAAADYDNDGDQDLVVADWGGENPLYRNDAGAFTNVTAVAGLGGDLLYSTGVAWCDFDLDGDLDLYVANRGLTEIGEPNRLYENQNDGTFVEVGAALGVGSQRMTFQPLWCDYDRDGDSDLYLANDRDTVNELFRNDGGTFTDVSVAAGADLSMDGMGNDAGDVNADGFPDFYVTNTQQGNRCLVNQQDGTFVESAGPLGIAVYEVGWGACFLDVDLDGDEDLYEVNLFHTPNKLFVNDGPGAWSDQSAAAGVEGNAQSYGCTVADFDGDGDLDLFTSNRNSNCEVYRNVTAGSGHWLTVDCQGVVSNRDAIGARVEIEIGGVTQWREVRAGSSYLSQLPRVVHFGLGDATTVDKVTVRWPSGLIDEVHDVAADQRLHVVESEGSGVPATGAPAVGQGLVLAPNPASGPWRVSIPAAGPLPARLRVIDVAGRVRVVRELEPQAIGARATWDLSLPASLPRGLYVVEVTAGGDRWVDRFTWIR